MQPEHWLLAQYGRGRHRKSIVCSLRTVGCTDISHLSIGRDVGDVGGDGRQTVARIGGQIPFHGAGAAHDSTTIRETADRGDLQPGRGWYAAAGQREIQRHLLRRASREARRGELDDIHRITGFIAGRRGHRGGIAVRVLHHGIEGDQMTAAVGRQRYLGDVQNLAILGRGQERGILRRIRGREDLDERG